MFAAQTSSRLKAINGNVYDIAALQTAMQGQDIVYINLAGDLAQMGSNIIQAMQDKGVRRVIAICSIGIYAEPVPAVLRSYRALADFIENSGLDYTILRPDWFTNAAEINYALTQKSEPERGSTVSRRSIATFINKLFAYPDTHIGENLGISKP